MIYKMENENHCEQRLYYKHNVMFVLYTRQGEICMVSIILNTQLFYASY